ncbi:MAG: Helix-turn-helix domain [Ferruginibacter sp.]|uniref:helix-turn-helix domain-containing protein n=1 Tax=Ferruginibacter sp. TaxID=1940288 RepID=UPI00265AD593|nr:helix-turn-helix transcriptional regulator [Ferruginibacter sp.]MDB5278832.1 Helix-turn-helix domain [Ferruginibacter sp.]
MSNGEYLKLVGAKVKAARRKRKMTLQQVGKDIGIHYSSISFLENGKSNMHLLTLKGIADLFKMNVKDFL